MTITRRTVSASAARRMTGYDPLLALWATFVIAVPFYVFRSGYPQPADLLMVVVLVATATIGRAGLKEDLVGPLKAVALFVGYVVAVNLVWIILAGPEVMDGKIPAVLTPAFYIYNGAVLTAFFLAYMRYGDRFLRVTMIAVCASVLLQVLVSMAVWRSVAFRGSLFFNNPNQLGYYALLSGSILVIGGRRIQLPAWLYAATLAGVLYLAMVSNSKAALVGLCALSFVFIRRTVRAGLGLALLSAFLWGSAPGARLVDNMALRLSTAGQSGDDNLEGRGYQRIIENPQWWIFGAAEGGTERFAENAMIELHSSWGTIFFSYGIVGTLLFALLVVHFMRGGGWPLAVYLAPTFLYGLTHQGLRFTLFWIVLGIAACTKPGLRSPRRTFGSTIATTGRSNGRIAAPSAESMRTGSAGAFPTGGKNVLT